MWDAIIGFSQATQVSSSRVLLALGSVLPPVRACTILLSRGCVVWCVLVGTCQVKIVFDLSVAPRDPTTGAWNSTNAQALLHYAAQTQRCGGPHCQVVPHHGT